MNRFCVLLVEDNPELSNILSRFLRRFYQVERVATLTGAWNYVAEKAAGYDVVLLDRVLPDGDGLELLPLLHQDAPQTKICVLSNKDASTEKVRGLKAGADCYLPKPLVPAELLATLEALLRRGKIATPDALRKGPLVLNEHEQVLSSPDGMIALTARETEFLATFLRSQDGRVSQDQLLNIFWHRKPKSSRSVVHVNIQRLRRRLQPLGVTIRSLYGLGYQLVLPGLALAETV